MARLDPCTILSNNIAQRLDHAMSQGLEHQSTQRSLPTREAGTKVSVEEGGIWRTPEGWLAHDIGPNVVPYTVAERISLIGHVAGLNGEKGNAGGRQLATKIERLQNTSDVSSRTEWQFLNYGDRKSGFRGIRLDQLRDAEHVNLIEVIEARPSTLDEFGMHAFEVGSKPVAPMNERVAYAADVLRQYFKDSDNLLQNEKIAGYNPFHKPSNYFPIMQETNTLRTNMHFQNNAVNGLAKKIAAQDGRSVVEPIDVEAANRVFQYYVNKQHAKVGANIQRDRVWDIGAERLTDTSKVIQLYAQQKWKAIHEKRIFGERNSEHAFPESIRQLMGSIETAYNSDNGVVQQLDALVKDTFGIVPSDSVFNHAVIRSLNGLQGLKLSMSVIKNSSQSGNTAMVTSIPTLLKSIRAFVQNSEVSHGIGARDFAGMMASVTDQSMYEATLWQGTDFIGRSVSNVLNWSQFTRVERWNRSFAGISGAFFAERQAQMFAETGGMKYARQLTELGIRPDRALASIKETGTLTLQDKLIAGQKIINATQFRARASDLPFFATHNPAMWRSFLTFKTFSINQTRLMVDMAHKRPARALVFGAAVMPAVGMGVNFGHDLLYNDIIGAPRTPMQDNQDAMSQYLEAAASAGSYGIVSDVLSAMYMSGENQNYRHVFTPAMISSAEDYLLMAGELMHGKFPQFARTVGRQLGGVGAAFTRAYIPTEE